MNEVTSADPITSRFEKVLRFYWDGIAVPPFVVGKTDGPRKTFLFRLLGYSPDYFGEVELVEIVETPTRDVPFTSLASRELVTTSMSARIGSHYSPFVGLFRFRAQGQVRADSVDLPKDVVRQVRIPAERCEDSTSVYPDSTAEYRYFVRMRELVQLYEPLVKEHSRMSRDSLRRIVVMATHGLDETSKQWVVREMCVVTDEFTKWLCEAVFFYMCADPTFRRVVAPLQVMTARVPRHFTILTLSDVERQASRRRFHEARRSLEESLCWGNGTRSFFDAMRVCWKKDFRQLALFDLSLESEVERSEVFLEQVANSMRAAFVKIRVEFYSNLEHFFFSYVSGAKSILVMEAEEIQQSRFHRIFLAARVFEINQLRELLFENLQRLVDFFLCDGKRGRRLTPKTARRQPLLQVDLVIGEKYEPRSPAFSHFRFGILDLFDELLDQINGFPLPEHALLRTLNVDNTPLSVADNVETAFYRASIMDVLDEVAATIDDVSHRYSRFADLPTVNSLVARSDNFRNVQEYAHSLRDNLCELEAVSSNVIYAGRFAIVCASAKEQYRLNWAQCLERFYAQYHRSVATIISGAIEKCLTALAAIQGTPRTLAQLEEYLKSAKAAENLAWTVRATECEQVVTKFRWMEEIQIPADAAVYEAALELMKWPERLKEAASKSESVKEKSRPLLVAEVRRLRTETRANIRTLATGVTELYNMFNLEICDIAAQTCSELRELVDHVELTVEAIRYQELSLGLSADDDFDDLPPLLNYFGTIEQFWMTVNKATGLRELYTTPVSSLNVEKVIEEVREWRRLIHASTRGLRAFAPLVRLGQQQELALAKFEALEDLLKLLTTPGLRKSHWKDIGRLVVAKLGDDVAQVSDMTVSLQKLLDAGIADFMADLERIALQARSDFEVESKLEEMKSVAKRTYFQVISVCDAAAPRRVMSAYCRQNVASFVEEFVCCSRVLRRNRGLSPLVLKAVDEWESSSERTRDTFLFWEQLDEQWGGLFSFYLALDKIRKTKQAMGGGDASANHFTATALGDSGKVMLEKLQRVADVFDTIYTTVSKPQFSLYTAIVQESIADNLSTAKLVMDNVTASLADTFAQMRESFPRFHFVTDEELLSFLTANDAQRLIRLLPTMYARLSSVTVENNKVTAFSTGDGGSIPAAPDVHLMLADELSDQWMGEFDRCLTFSLFHAIRNCAAEYTQGDIDTWIGSWCSQLLVMALRITHTKDMRDTIQFAGSTGLRAYKTKMDSIVDELSRLANAATAETEMAEPVVRARLTSALLYSQHAAKEVELALQNRIASCADLDATAMLQTFMTDNTITVRLLGMDFAYGFEFLGDSQVSPMAPQLVEKVATMLVLNGGAGKPPILCGGVEKEQAVDLASQILGCFLMRIQCCEMTSLSVLRPHLRGAIEVGAMLCVQDCERIPRTVQAILTTCIHQVRESLAKQQDGGVVKATLPLGDDDGAPLFMPVSPRFLAVWTTESVEAVSHSLTLEFRAIHFHRFSSPVVVHSYLTSFGMGGVSGLCSPSFGALYEQFREVSPVTFSDAALLAVLRGAVLEPLAGPPTAETVMERLLSTFLNIFSSRIREDGRLRQLLEWNMEHKLSAFNTSDECQTAIEQLVVPVEKLGSEGLFVRFAEMMTACTNAVVVGPGFSGKTKLWRRWVGAAAHTVFSPSLMTSEDFYGSLTRPGLLSFLGKGILKSTEPHFVIVEDGDLSSNSLWAAWPQFSRAPGLDSCFITNPYTHVIVSTRTLRDTTPRLASDFGIFYLPPLRDWRLFLKDCIRDSGAQEAREAAGPAAGKAPNSAPRSSVKGSAHGKESRSHGSISASQLNDIAFRVMETLIPGAFAATQLWTPSEATATPATEAGSRTSTEDAVEWDEEGNNRLFALCQRCGGLFKRWYQYATQQYNSVLGRLSEDNLVDNKTFAAQCAVFAVCWASGLYLEESEHYRITEVLRESERELQAVNDSFCIIESPLPQQLLREKDEGDSAITGRSDGKASGHASSVLRLVVTRGGWKTFEEARAFGINQSWSTYSNVSVSSPVWSQRFFLASRLPVLGAVECLLNCGQSVILCGSQGSGKSSLLQTIPLNDRWVSQLVSTNKSLNPTFVQEEMLTGLKRRSNGRFGPSLGRKLIVCIDDVHLSHSVEANLPLIARLISFCDKFAAINTPTNGFTPVTDVVFLGTSQERRYDAMVIRACVKVRMPNFVGSELLHGLWQLFEVACGKKRVEGFPAECASFLTLAHSAFARLLPSIPEDLLVGAPCTALMTSSLASRQPAPRPRRGSGADRGPESASPRSNLAVVEAEALLPWRLRDCLRAAEFIRQQLVSANSDMQVATNMFSAVTSLYSAFMESSGAAAEVAVFQSRIEEAARDTLGTCLRGEGFAGVLAKERAAEADPGLPRRTYHHPALATPAPPSGTSPKLQQDAKCHELVRLSVSDSDRDRVAEWITEFEVTIDEVCEEDLETKYDRKSSANNKEASRKSLSSTFAAAAVTRGAPALSRETDGEADGAATGSSSGGADLNARGRATLITYAGAVALYGQSSTTTPRSRPGSGPRTRLVGSCRSSISENYQRRSSVTTPRRVSLRSNREGAGGPQVPLAQVHNVSKTYQTTWLTAVLAQLYRTVHQHDSHAALVGEDTFGTQRLLRLMCSATRAPLAVFRDSRESYTFPTFKKELRSLVMFAYVNDVRTNAFFPHKVLQIPGVMRQLDIIIRSGEINELFTVEERAAVARGYPHTHRGASPLSSVEYVEMRRRVRRNLRFIAHLPSLAALTELAGEYQSVARATAIPLHTPEFTTATLREVVMGILTEEQVAPLIHAPAGGARSDFAKNDRFPMRVLHDNEELSELLSLIFETVRSRHPSTRLEQLMELAREVRRVRETLLGPFLRAAETAAVIPSRADEATAEITRGAEAAKQATAELATTRATVESLKARLAEEERELSARSDAVLQAKADLADEEKRLEEAEAKIQESLQKSAKALATAASKLRRVKSTFVRSLAVLRLPEKGVLLVKAIYRLLNEDLPNYGNSPSTLWTMALRFICTPEFPGKMASRLPEKEKEPATLLAMEEELSEVRYVNASPYAQLIADFILAYMSCIRTEMRVSEEDLPRLSEQRAELAASERDIEDLEGREADARIGAAETAAVIAHLEDECAGQEKLAEQLAEREKHLFRFVGLVDRFTGFVPKKQIEVVLRDAERAEGNAIMVSTFLSLLSPHVDGTQMFDTLQQLLLSSKGIPSSPLIEEACLALFFSGHKTLVSQLVSPELPLRHRVALHCLHRRVVCRWQLFGGVCSTWEQLLKEYLAVECSSCAVVSALDPTVKEQVLRAMKVGEGILLRDADNQAAFEIARELFPLLAKLHAHRRSVARGGTGSDTGATEKAKMGVGGQWDKPTGRKEGASTAFGLASKKRVVPSTEAEEPVKIPFRAFGTDVDVDPRFFLVGTSTGLFFPDQASPVSEFASVFNFFTPIPCETRFRALMLSTSSPKNTAEETRERRERFFRSLRAFVAMHHTACDLLGRNLKDIVDGDTPAAEMDRIEMILMEVDTHNGELAHAAALMQSTSRQQREAWEPLERPLAVSATLLSFLEARKLGRPWDDRILDSFVATITTLSPKLSARLAPQVFADLPRPLKIFYALVNYLDSVIQTFACGWPAPVRGVFSLYLFAGVSATCEEIAAHRGVLFPNEVELLSRTQWSVLHSLLSGAPVEAADLQLWHLEQFVNSGDATLKSLAQEIGSGNPSFRSPFLTAAKAGQLPAHRGTFLPTPQASVVMGDRRSGSVVAPAGVPAEREDRRGRGSVVGPGQGDMDSVPLFSLHTSSTATFVAHLFRCLVEADFERGDAAAQQLCGSFFAAVKDANAVSKHEGPSGGGATGGNTGAGGTTYNTFSAREGRHIQASTLAGRGREEVSRASFAAADRANHRGGNTSAEVSPVIGQPQIPSTEGDHDLVRLLPTLPGDRQAIREVHSRVAVARQAAESGLPVCIPAQIPMKALKRLRQDATTEKWAFQWHEAERVQELEPVNQAMLACFHRRPLRHVGHLLCVCAEIDEERRSPEEVRLMVARIHRFLATYQGYRTSLSITQGSSGGVPVCVVLICTLRTHSLLWDTSVEGAGVCRMRCLYDNDDFFTPQEHLLALLQSKMIQDGLGSFSTVRSTFRGGGDHHSGRGGGGMKRSTQFHEEHQHGDTDSADRSAPGQHKSGKGVGSNAALTPLEVAATLIAKELAVVHVVVVARQAFLVKDWGELSCASTRVAGGVKTPLHAPLPKAASSPFMLPCLRGSHFNDDDSSLTVLLQQLHSWVQRSLRMVDAVASGAGAGHSAAADAEAMSQIHLPPGTVDATQAPVGEKRLSQNASLAVSAAANSRGMSAIPADSGSATPRPPALRGKAAVPPPALAQGPPAEAKISLGMQAYLLYRNQRTMWRLHANAAEMGARGRDATAGKGKGPSTPSVSLASFQGNVPMLGEEEGVLRAPVNAVAPSHASSVFPSSVLLNADEKRLHALKQLRDMSFTVFQKIAYEQYAGGGSSNEERVALQRAVGTLLVPPQDTHPFSATSSPTGGLPMGTSPETGSGTGSTGAAAGASGTVSCNLTGLDPCCPLQLDASPDFARFAADVSHAGSNLMELIGDSAAYHVWRDDVRRQVKRLLFSKGEAAADGAADVDGRRQPLSPVSISAAGLPTTSQFDEDVRDVLSDWTITALVEKPRGGRSAAGVPGGEELLQDWQTPFGQVQDVEAVDNDRDSSHEGQVLHSRPAPQGSTAALIWQLEESGLRHLYDTLLDVHHCDGQLDALLWERRALVMETARSIASAAWQRSTCLNLLVRTPRGGAAAERSTERQHPLSLWMPALRRPNVTVTLMMDTLTESMVQLFHHGGLLGEGSRGVGGAAAGEEGATSSGFPAFAAPVLIPPAVSALAGETMLMLVIGRRHLLSPHDIIASRARPSQLLLAEMKKLTRRSEGSRAADEDGDDLAKDIVVAFRSATLIRHTGRHRQKTDDGRRVVKTIQFYDLVSDGNNAWRVVRKTLRVAGGARSSPSPSSAKADADAAGGFAFLWRPPSLANRAPTPESTPTADADGEKRHFQDATDTLSGGNKHFSTSLASSAVLRESAPDASRQSPPPPPLAPPTFVTATDELGEHFNEAERGGGSSTLERDSVKPPMKIHYAVSRFPVLFYSRSLHEDDVHAAGKAADAVGSAVLNRGAEGDAGSSRVTGGAEEGAVCGARERWREAIELPVCFLFEAPEENEGLSQGCSQESQSVAASHVEVDVLPICFPHAGALGHYVVCD